MRKRLLLVAAVLTCSAALGDEPRQLLRTPLAELYSSAPTLSDPSLSPDGSKVAAVRPADGGGGGGLEIIVRDFAKPEPSVILRRPSFAPLGCTWKTDTKLLCATSTKGPLSRWLSVNVDGTGEKDLGLFDKIIHIMPDEPGRVLVTQSEPPYTYTFPALVDLETGKSARRNVDGLVGDGTGLIRVRRYDRRHDTGWAFLPAPKKSWIVLYDDDFNTREWFRPLAFDERRDEVLYRHLLADRLALFAWDGHGERRLVHAEPFAHVTNVRMIGKLSRAGSAVVLDGQVRYEPIDPRVASVRDAVQRVHPSATVNVLEEDWNQHYYLVFAGDRQGAGRYYRFAPDDGALDEVGETRANLEDRVAAQRTMLDVSGAVGRPAAAWVTVPPNAAGPLPAVVLPAGASNWADDVAPFLVASGFVLIESGVEPLRRGQEIGANWSSSAAEIGAAVGALARSGTVDPGRVCAVGRQLGAYVALMSAADSPKLFRCVVGIDTTIDPVIGDQMVASLKSGVTVPVPVLLLGGETERSAVRLRHALEDHGAPSAELVSYDEAMFRGAWADRIDQLARLGEFLAAHLR